MQSLAQPQNRSFKHPALPYLSPLTVFGRNFLRIIFRGVILAVLMSLNGKFIIKTDKFGRKRAAVRKTISFAEPGGAFSGGALIYYISNFINPLSNIVLFKVEFGYTYDIVYTS